MRGSTGAGPLKALDEKSLAAGGQRWRFIPLHQRLKDTSARPASLPSAQFDSNLADVHPSDTNFSHLSAALTANSETNITLTFTQYLQQVRPLALSLPLIYRNRKRLIHLTLEALETSTRNASEATPPIATCLAALTKDLGPKQFHPFFPKVIQTFALVLDTKKFHESIQNEKVSVPSAPSALWDPETSMIPLFAALSEITKIGLQWLASDPGQTIQDLLPLLGHFHYRVREMAAESCLGYLLRKTRDLDVLAKLVQGLLDVLDNAEAKQMNEEALLDGLGASMFEAVRLPSGRLHARGTQVLFCALQRLEEVSRGLDGTLSDESALGRRTLNVISLCFARLCRHLTDAADKRTILLLCIKSGEEASKRRNAAHVGNAAFLCERWVRICGLRVTFLDPVTSHKFLNALSDWATRFASEPRVVYECLGGLLTTISSFKDDTAVQSSTRVLRSTLAKVSACTERQTLLCATSVVLKMQGKRAELIDSSTTTIFADLCDQMARVSTIDVLQNPTVRISTHALERALSLGLCTAKPQSEAALSPYARLKIPELETQLISVLSHPSITAKGGGLEQLVPEIVQKGIMYLSRVHVSDSKSAFENLLATDNLETEGCERLLQALFLQYRDRTAEMSPLLSLRMKVMIEHLLDSLQNSVATPSGVEAITSYCRLFPQEAKVIILNRFHNSEESMQRLCSNLSSVDGLVRLRAAELLISVSKLLADDCSKESQNCDIASPCDVQQSINVLRRSFASEAANITEFFSVLSCAFHTMTTLSRVDETLRLLREMARLIRTSKDISRIIVFATIHFSIGLLRTPFRLLWGCASDIWSAAASHLTTEAVSVIIQKLQAAESNLIARCRENEDMAADANEIDHDVTAGDVSMVDVPAKDGMSTPPMHNTATAITKRKGRRRNGSMNAIESDAKSDQPLRKKRNNQAFSTQQWNCDEWKRYGECGSNSFTPSRNDEHETRRSEGGWEGSTDDVSFVREILRTLSQNPKHASPFRGRIISSNLRLSPALFSRRVGNAIAISFAGLLEKIGGARRGSEGDIEHSLFSRFLSDLTRPCSQLQVISLKCLAASRVNPLKRYRESFIRLIEDASFRDELSALKETLLPNLTLDENGDASDKDTDLVLDVLLRICFSKMRGKLNRTESRRAAALTFIVSQLPAKVALPRVITLILSPIAKIVEDTRLEVFDSGPMTGSESFPALNVQMGLLTSIESLMKHCHRSLDFLRWQCIAAACFALLRNAGAGSGGKNLRSRCVRVLADMCRAREKDTSPVIGPVLIALRDAKFDVEGGTETKGIPSLLYFMSSVFESDVVTVRRTVILEESWAMLWCLRRLEPENADLENVHMALGVAGGLLPMILDAPCLSSQPSDPSLQVSMCLAKVTAELSSCILALIRRLPEKVMTDRSRTRRWVPVFSKALGIVERLIQTTSLESTGLLALFEGLVTYVECTKSFSLSYEQALAVLTTISNNLFGRRGHINPDDTKSHLQQVRSSALRLMPLLARPQFANQPKAHHELCELLGSLEAPDLRAVGACLKRMNSMMSSQIDTPDLDERINALNDVIRAFKDALEDPTKGDRSDPQDIHISVRRDDDGDSQQAVCYADAITALAHGCIVCAMSDDIAVRGTSGYALQLMGKWSAVTPSTTAQACQKRLFRILIEAVVNARRGITRREFARALGTLVRHSQHARTEEIWPGYSTFRLLKSMTNLKDPDSDFFENLVHLQSHRRSRALRQIQKQVLNAEMSRTEGSTGKDESLSAFACAFSLPLSMQIALELSEHDEQPKVISRHAESRSNAEKDVAIWAVEVIRSSACCLQWTDLKSCICEVLRRIKMSKREQQSQSLYKILVVMVEAFPRLDGTADAPDSTMKGFCMNMLLPTLLKHITLGGVEGGTVEVTNTTAPGRFADQRPTSVPEIFRAPLAVAVAQLLTCLPSHEVEVIVPRLITPLSSALRSRKIALRDSAKKALTSVVLTLGSRYLPYILQQVLSALNQGFRKDACVYVIHSILIGVRDSRRRLPESASASAIEIDESAHIIATHLCEELQRGTTVTSTGYEDPNVSSFLQKQTSARTSRANDCAEILAEHIVFDKSAHIVMQPFRKVLVGTSSLKLMSKTENLLSRILSGFTKNQSMRPKDALKVCYELISHSRNELKNGPADEDPGMSISDSGLQGVTKSDVVIIAFGMQLLCSVVSKHVTLFGGKSVESRECQAMVQPFLPLVLEAMETKYDELTVVALRAAQKLLKLPLPNKTPITQVMSERLVDVLAQNAGLVTHTDTLFNSCLRAAAVLMHEVGAGSFNALSKDRVEALISISCKCMESGGLETRSAAISLLKAAVTSKVMIPALYDAIEKINETVVHAQSSSLRSSCIAISVQFAVSFPLGSRRVRQHLEFFVRNLNYELPTGRLAALKVIKTIILKFPTDVLENESQYLFIALSASAARDSEEECRSSASSALKLLFERVPTGRSITVLLQMATVLTGVKADMTSLSEDILISPSVEPDISISGVFALTTACKSGRLTPLQLNMVVRVLVATLVHHQDSGHWELIYALLQALETAFDRRKDAPQSERLEVQSHTQPFWEFMPGLLLHTHPWIRLSAARLLGSHLSVYGDHDVAGKTRPEIEYSLLWDSSVLVRDVLKSCCSQLEAVSVSKELAKQCLKNLLCIANVTFQRPFIADLATAERETRERDVDQDMEGNPSSISRLKSENPGLHWLLCRISGLALRTGGDEGDMLRRGCALRFFLVTTQWWGFDFVRLHRNLYIAPIVRVLEQGHSKVDAIAGERKDSVNDGSNEGIGLDGLKQIAITLQDALVQGLGGSVYYEEYQVLRTERHHAKQARKRQAAFELAVNPERAAKRRRRKAERRKKKRVT